MLILNDDEVRTLDVFRPMPKFSTVSFKGLIQDRVRHFEAVREEETLTILATAIIRKEEKFLWESCEDLLKRSVEEAAARVSGVYRFDMLSFNVHREINTFNPQELSQMILNHSRKLKIGEERFIKYSSSFGVIKKLAQEDWGKVVLRSFVEVFNKEPAQLDLTVKQLMAVPAPQQGPKVLVIHDLSLEPVFNRDNAGQQDRLQKLRDKQADLFESRPDVYLIDKNGCVEL